MMFNRNFLRRNITLLYIILYLVLYCLIITSKPAFLYNSDGSLRNFGIGFRSKTVIPVWLLAIILAIISYFAILYYIAVPKLINF